MHITILMTIFEVHCWSYKGLQVTFQHCQSGTPHKRHSKPTAAAEQQKQIIIFNNYILLYT